MKTNMFLRHALCLLFFIALIKNVRSQQLELEYVKDVVILATDSIHDPLNSYSTGLFHGTIFIGTDSINSFGRADAFVSRSDKTGKLLWFKRIGGQSDDVGFGVSVDKNGNVYVSGQFKRSAKFDNETELTVLGAADAFLSKYDRNGNLVWTKQAYATLDGCSFDLVIDTAGFIYTTGYFSDSAFSGKDRLISLGFRDMFLAKYTPDGDIVWTRQAGGIEDDYADRMIIWKNGDIYLSGFFTGKMFFPGVGSVDSRKEHDCFRAKCTPDGEFKIVIYGDD